VPVEESVAVTVKVKDPVAVGLPVIAPPEDKLRPVGRLPLVTANV
jgi:hypothetical protein